jgi:hypothetical protein
MSSGHDRCPLIGSPQISEGVTSVTLHQTLMASEWDSGNWLNYYPYFTSIPFPISSHIFSQSLIHNLSSLLPYPCIVAMASAMEFLPSINT